jgi:hypothetical protein
MNNPLFHKFGRVSSHPVLILKYKVRTVLILVAILVTHINREADFGSICFCFVLVLVLDYTVVSS